jgi:outer membrane protein assembly factor BamB
MGAILSCAMVVYATAAGIGKAVADESVITYHNAADRSGLYVVPTLTWAEASAVKQDTGFHAGVDGWVYAQPLYWVPRTGGAALIVATEQNFVYALDASTGKQIWVKSLGTPVPLKALPCGNLNPMGVTGTPVIDPVAEIVYLEAYVDTASGPRHFVFGLSLATGATAPGWPVDIGKGLGVLHHTFDETPQGQRSALALINGKLYVPYAGHDGDCGLYNGIVVGLNTAKPGVFGEWSTKTQGGGSWGQSGVAFDGAALYVTTGNAFGASTVWGGSEAVVKLPLTLADPTANDTDFFTPTNWHSLDERDRDLGGTSAIPVWTPTIERVLALGKDGNAYLINPENLGGVGHEIAVTHVSTGEIRTAMAVFPSTSSAMVVYGAGGGGAGAACPKGQSGNLVMLKVTPSAISPAWCSSYSGAGAPIVTTTDGKSNPIVWVAGARGIYGFRGTDGKLLASPTGVGTPLGEAMLFANRRFYVATANALFAFTY